jgi:hypothetical protein
VGDVAVRIRDRFQKQNRNKVTDRSTVDRDGISSRGHRTQISLACLLRQSLGQSRCWHNSIINFSLWNHAPLRSEATVHYEAILLGLRKLGDIAVQTCILHIDSKVVAGPLEKECIVREPTLERYLALVRRMESYFKGFTVVHIERNKNSEADELAKAVACNTLLSADVFFQVL